MTYIPEKITNFSPNKQQLLELLLKQKGIDVEIFPTAKPSQIKQAPISFAQQAIWQSSFPPHHPIHHLNIALQLTGPLNKSALETSFSTLIERHQSLRTSFDETGTIPKQIIAEKINFQLTIIRLTDTENSQAEIQTIINQQTQKPFDLNHPPLWRATLLHKSKTDHLLLLTLHQLIADNYSLEILLQELTQLYHNFTQNTPQELPPISVQYADISQWQRYTLTGEYLENYLDYWQQQIQDTQPTLLPTDNPTTTTQASQQTITLPYTLSRNLRTLAQREGVTLFITLLTAFQLLLHRYTGTPEIAIAVPFTNRNHPQYLTLIGNFVNTLLVKTNLEQDPSFSQLLAQVKTIVAGAINHSELPLEIITEQLKIPEKSQPTIAFSLEPSIPSQPLNFPGLTLNIIDIPNASTHYQLALTIEDKNPLLQATITYQNTLFQPTTITNIFNDLQTLLNRIIHQPKQPISYLTNPITPKHKTPLKTEPKSTDNTPINQTQEQLKQIWEETLNIHPINLKDNFFEIGGHSLLAVRVFTKIKEKFQKDLPLATLFQAPTIEELAKLLTTQEQATWKSLVTIQTGTTKPPLFCIHAVGGNVLSYQPIATYLGEEYPVYGLQARGLDGEQTPQDNLQKMAESYIEEMQTVQPQGPYYLIGHSLGGVIAFAIAQQLVKSGEKVGLLGFLDTYSPIMVDKGIPPFSYQLKIHQMNLNRKKIPGKIKYISERLWWKILDKIQTVFPDFLRDEWDTPADKLPPHFIQIEKANSRAIKTYDLQPYPGKAILFRSEERPARHYYEPLLGWRDFVLGGVEIQEVPGHHKTLILEPQVRILTQELKACLEQAEIEQQNLNKND